MGITTTILELEKELAAMLENANKHHAAALAYYPDEIYKTYDEQAVKLRKDYAILSNMLDIKYIESGANGIDKEIQYLQAREKELEKFYYILKDPDKQGLEQSINDIRSKIWDLKKEKNRLLTTNINISF